MIKSLNQNTIISHYDSLYPETSGPINVFVKLDRIREHVSPDDNHMFYSVRPLCIKRGSFINSAIEYYFNIKSYLVDMMKKSDAEYFSLVVYDDPREFTDPDGFKHQYYSSKLQTIHGESVIAKLVEYDKPRLEEYPGELFDDEL